MHWLLETPPRKIGHALRVRVLPNLRYLAGSTIRACGCCNRRTIVLRFAESEEFTVCLRCRANLRYEMLATVIRDLYPDLPASDVLELDKASPLRAHLTTARTYTRTYYDSAAVAGAIEIGGAQMQDVTKLGFADASFDLIVSSEVLEHVPDLQRAFAETYRVLRPGGRHLFTVPNARETKRLAELVAGGVRHLVQPPEYHGDPLGDGTGILAFWHLAPDFATHIDTGGLAISIVSGPLGHDRRIVWCAQKPAVTTAAT